jgi:hypothetical protein
MRDPYFIIRYPGRTIWNPRFGFTDILAIVDKVRGIEGSTTQDLYKPGWSVEQSTIIWSEQEYDDGDVLTIEGGDVTSGGK